MVQTAIKTRLQANSQSFHRMGDQDIQSRTNESAIGQYRAYDCVSRCPLSCDRTHPSTNQTLSTCSTCQFPSRLAAGTQIVGQHHIYEIEDFLSAQGNGRLYKAHTLPDLSSVTIKEYLLPERTFNRAESYERKQQFQQLAGLSLADGRSQDTRLIVPIDTIVDDSAGRCYVVTSGDVATLPNLRTFLSDVGAAPSEFVIQVLLQTLQTLVCLHEQKFRLPNGQIKTELAHGNLSLDTILIQTSTNSTAASSISIATYTHTQNFLVHLCDPALWESIFVAPSAATASLSVASDLKQAGLVGLALLRGNKGKPIDEQSLDLSQPLERFLANLQGIGGEFATAAEARKALRSLQNSSALSNQSSLPLAPLTQKQRSVQRPWLSPLLIAAGSIALITSLITFGLKLRDRWLIAPPNAQPLCCIDQVSGLSSGEFDYVSHELGTWHQAQNQKRQISGEEQKFLTLLKNRQPKINVSYTPVLSMPLSLQAVLEGEYDFAIAPLSEPFSSEFTTHTFAYDGLAVVVAFTYAQRRKSLPAALNGKISFEQLRQLYTGEVTNWRQLGGPDLPVKLYLPTDPEAVRLFERAVLKDGQTIRAFRQQRSNMEALPPLALLRQILRDFETDSAGAISFAPISQLYGQCSVYPLALKEDGERAIQALVQDNGRAVTPRTNLCEAKGSYFQNEAIFRSGEYPLSYPLGVVYPNNNKRSVEGQIFTEVLKTREVQDYISQTSLIPLYPLSENLVVEEDQ